MSKKHADKRSVNKALHGYQMWCWAFSHFCRCGLRLSCSTAHMVTEQSDDERVPVGACKRKQCFHALFHWHPAPLVHHQTMLGIR